MEQGTLNWDQIIDEYRSGDSAKALALRHGFHEQSLFYRLKKQGVPTHNGKAGKKHWNWKGGRCISHGYMKVRQSGPYLRSEVDRDGYVLEHRLVVAESLKRDLKPFETVHHKDGDRLNNKLSNLQLRVGAHGPGVALCCAECGSTDLEALTL